MASYNDLAACLAAFVRFGKAGKLVAPRGSLIELGEFLVAEARRGLNRPVAWTPFEKAAISSDQFTPANLTRMAEMSGFSLRDLTALLAAAGEGRECWVNSRYQVLVWRKMRPIWLSIKRIDQDQIHSWRDLQRIKNELVGKEWEAVELYPAESRLVDSANQYHLWVMPTRFDFGFPDRMVIYDADVGEAQAPPEVDDMSRADHLNWAKARALPFLARMDLQAALTSFVNDLTKHRAWQTAAGFDAHVMAGMEALEAGAFPLMTWIGDFQ